MNPKDERYDVALNSPGEGLSLDSPGQVVVSSLNQGPQPQTLPSTEISDAPAAVRSASLFRFNSLAATVTAVAVVLVLVAGGLAALLSKTGSGAGGVSNSSLASHYAVGSTLPVISSSPDKQITLGTTDSLAINGQLKVNQTIVLTPSTAPSSPVTGQVYYNKTTNQPYFYNGSSYVSLLPTQMPKHVTSIGGLSGSISVGDGLQVTSSGVLSLNANSLQAIKTALSPSVSSIISSTSTLSITNDGSGNYTLTDSSITSSSAGQIAYYTGTNTVGGSILSQSGNSSITDTGSLAVQGSGGISVGIAGSVDGSVSLANSTNTNLSKIQSAAPSGSGTATYILPTIAGGTSDTFCLGVLKNCSATGFAGGDLTGTYPDPTIASLQGSALSVTAPGSGQVLLFNGTAFVNQTISGDITINAAGVATIGAGKVTNSDLANSSLSVNAGNGLSGGGSISLGASTSLAVQYGSAANTAVQGNVTLTCPSGTGNLSGGGNSITLGTGGGCNSLTVVNSPSFSGNLTVQGSSGVTVGVVGTTNGVIKFANSTNSNLSVIQSGVPSGSGSASYFLPSIAGGTSDTFCLVVLANCGTGGAGGGNVDSLGGIAGAIPVYTGPTDITSSTLTQSGSTLTASGNLVLQGANSLQLGTAATNNGDITFYNSTNSNTVLLQSGATSSPYTLTLPTSLGATNDCLVDGGGGALVFTACSGGAGGGVYSLDSQTGVLSLANSSGLGGVITIDNAAANGSTKGIATFNATNFSDNGSGVINTIQDIDSSASPTFAGLTLSSALTVASGGTGVGTFTSNGVLYGNGTGALQVTSAGTSGQLLIADGSGIPTFVSLSGDVTVSNAGVTTIGAGKVTNADLVNSSLTVTANTGLTGGGSVSLGGSTSLAVAYGSAAGTAVQGNVTLTCPSGTGNLSGGGNSITLGTGGSCSSLTITNSPTFSGNLAVQGSSGVTVGVAGTTKGVVNLANTTNTNLSTLQASAPSGIGTATYNLPSIAGATSDTVCLQSLGNCSGAVGAAGGDLTGSYPNPTIAKLQGSTLTITSPSSGQLLLYNGSAFVNQTVSGDVTINSSGVTTIGAGKVTNTDLVNSSVTINNGTNITGGGSLSLGGSLTLGVSNSPTFSGLVTANAGLTVTGTTTLNTALTVANGGTGLASTTAYGLLAGGTTSTGPLQNIGTGTTSQILIGGTLGSAAPSFTSTLPTTVQGNITQVGALTSGSIASGFGTISTGNNVTTTTQIQGGTFRNTAGTFATDSSGNITSGTVNTATISGGTLSGGSVSGGTLTSSAVNSLNVSGTAISGTGTLSVDSNGSNPLTINGTATGDILLGGGSAATGCTVTNSTGAFACSSNINSVGGAFMLNGTSINTAGTLTNVAYQNQANTFTLSNTFSATSNALVLSGTPSASATSSVVRFGLAISGGSSSGTYLGANPASFSGNFVDLQVGNTSVFKVTSAGAITGAGGLTISGGTVSVPLSSGGTSIVCANGSTLATCSTTAVTKTIILTPEYAGAVLDNTGLASSVGTMTSGYDSTQQENYYQWTTSQSSNQSYYVVVSIPLPSLIGGMTSISVDTKTSNTSNGTVLGTLYDTNGTVVTNWNTCALTPSSTGAWQTKNCALGGSPTWTANDTITLKLKVQALNNGTTQLGNITVTYTAAY